MSTPTGTWSPVLEAEHARQVVGVLTWVERRFAAGKWDRGARFGDDGGVCLVGGIDEASRWTMTGVAEDATRQLAARLPVPLRALGRLRPRLALAMYNDLVGGRRGALQLVRRTRHELGGVAPLPGPTGGPAAQAEAGRVAPTDQPAPAAAGSVSRNRDPRGRPAS